MLYNEEDNKDLPILTILMCGSNDGSIESNKIQHIDIDEYEDNMKNIINYLLKLKSDMKIIVLTPTPIDDIGYKNHCASVYIIMIIIIIVIKIK